MIIERKLPATIVYENKTAIAFLDKTLYRWFEPKKKDDKPPETNSVILKKLKAEFKNMQ